MVEPYIDDFKKVCFFSYHHYLCDCINEPYSDDIGDIGGFK